MCTRTEIYDKALLDDIINTKNGSGTQFDPQFAKIMIKLIEADTEYSMREKTKSEE